MEHNLHVFNSITRQKERFEAINPPFVGMYVCGPTVYSDVHLGNCRTFISFDMVYRYLLHLGYKVRYVRNITDAGHLESDADEGEDKISKKARLEQIEPMEVVQRYTIDFHNILAAFNNLPPSIEPTATGHIVEQIEMIKEIIDKGLAYVVNGSVYFDVAEYNKRFDNSYGILSGRNTEELISGTRALDGQSEKRSPNDFALWKNASPDHIMRWPSPWGVGFPGWHLECSVMSTKYLGEQFDIHGGGMDLKFPHHECEIAQCKASNDSNPVKYWLHGNMLTLNGAKMSKSTGNTLLPYELFSGDTDKLSKGFDPAVVRFFILQAHYRSTLDFSNDALLAAEKGYFRLMSSVDDLSSIKASDKSSADINGVIASWYNAMDDDFNTPILIAKLFDATKLISSLKSGEQTLNQEDLTRFTSTLDAMLYDVLGLKKVGKESNDSNELVDGLMETILQLRMEARQRRDFGTADLIREKLGEMKIELKDSKDGTTWSVD